MRELSLMAEELRGVVNEKLFIFALSFVILRKQVGGSEGCARATEGLWMGR